MVIPTATISVGDALEKLRALRTCSVQCVVTSPPYYGLRDYGDPKQLGLERTPGLYIERLLAISREIRRVLNEDGVYWLNLGDCYYNYRPGGDGLNRSGLQKNTRSLPESTHRRGTVLKGFKEKDRLMIPARVAIALQRDGWYLRDEIVWHKPNPMPESVTDRCTKAHEMIYLLTKNQDYYFDQEAIREKGVIPAGTLAAKGSAKRAAVNGVNARPPEYKEYDGFRNKRSVWTVKCAQSADEHYAIFPEELIAPCILAGSRVGDTILDPFAGSGTTGKVAIQLGRNVILVELNPEYAKMCEASVNVTPGLALQNQPQPESPVVEHTPELF